MNAQLEEGQSMLSLFEEPTAARHDLPPLWDGVPVDWREWSRINTTLIHHAEAEDLACDKCGAVDELDVTFGRRGPMINLCASRCRHCGQDQVTDMLTGTLWDLDETDYADIGSEPPGAS